MTSYPCSCVAMAEQMMDLATTTHNVSASGAPPSLLLSPVSLAGIVVGSVLLALMVVAVGVLVMVLVTCKVRAATRSVNIGSSALPNG